MSKFTYLIIDNDESVLTAFSDESAANKFVSRNSDYYKVMKVSTDDEKFMNTRRAICFVCTINLKSGTVTGVPKHMKVGWEGAGMVYRRFHPRNSTHPDRVVVISTKSESHARDTAAKARDKYIEKGEWDRSDNLNQIVEFRADGPLIIVSLANLENEF